MLENKPAYGKLTKIAAKKLDKSKLFDKYIDVYMPKDFLINDGFGYYKQEDFDKEFFEVCDAIDDIFLRALFILEWEKLRGDTINFLPVFFGSPTSRISHEEAIQFYEDLLKKVKHDLDIEKQKSNFSEREYYRNKYKEKHVEYLSNMGVPRRLR